jgi:hypothetical protein
VGWFGHVARANIMPSICRILVVVQEWQYIRAGRGYWKAGGSENVAKGIGRQFIPLVHLVWCEDQ